MVGDYGHRGMIPIGDMYALYRYNVCAVMNSTFSPLNFSFQVYTPADSPGTMSVCSMQYLNQGSNFGCGNDFSSITAVLTSDPVGPGNYVGAMSLGQLLNMGKFRIELIEGCFNPLPHNASF